MTDPKNTSGDDHIEELLSQLQGIFGRLSNSEEEESNEKIDPSSQRETEHKSPEPPMVITASPPPPPEEVEPLVVEPMVAPEPLPPEPPTAEPPPVAVFEASSIPAPADPLDRLAAVDERPTAMVVNEEPLPAPAVEEILVTEPVTESPPALPAFEPEPEPMPPVTPVIASGTGVIELTPEELSAVEKDMTAAAIYYPIGRDEEAKALAQKLETLTPRFTKVTFRLKVIFARPFDFRIDFTGQLLAHIQGLPMRAIFVVVERPFEEGRKRALLNVLEPRGIYFQEVPLLSVEKKAFYTDLLLGMVFFFDSIKPPE